MINLQCGAKSDQLFKHSMLLFYTYLEILWNRYSDGFIFMDLWRCLNQSCPNRIHPNSPWTEGFTEVSQLDESSLEISTFQQNWRVASVESHRTRALLEFCCQVKFILVTPLDAYAMVQKPFKNTKKSQ